MYSHQESPIVHLLLSGPNNFFVFVYLYNTFLLQLCFCLVRFAFTLPFLQVNQNKTIHVHKVIHSLIHPFNRTRVGLYWDHLFSWVSVRLFGVHRVRLLYSHLSKRSAPRGETNWSSIQSNQTRQVWIHPKYLQTKLRNTTNSTINHIL